MAAEVRKCFVCGCTEERACVIQIVIASADGTSSLPISIACSWARWHPRLCTACDVLRDCKAIIASPRSDIAERIAITLRELFPEAFAPAEPAEVPE